MTESGAWVCAGITVVLMAAMFTLGFAAGFQIERKRWMDWLLARLNDRSVAHETAESHP